MTVPLTAGDLQSSPKRRRRERTVKATVFSAAAVSLVISVLIVVSLLGEAWAFLSELISADDLDQLWAEGWFPRRNMFGVSTLLVGSLVVTAIAMVVALPVGLASAVYLSEYANHRVRKVLKPTLEVLAGIPSVVLGFFAFVFISPEIIQKVFDGTPQNNLLAAGIGVGILTIPLVASVSEDAMRSVPMALREASYGLGARRHTTVIKVVLPAALSGLVAALIIAISRAIGETMVVAIAAGGSGGALFNWDPLQPGTTMTAAMISQAGGTDAVAGIGPSFQSLFFVGLLLFVITLAMNTVADRFVRRFREIY